MIPRLLLGVMIWISACAIVWAQGGATDALQGTVQDSTGAAVPGAEVSIIDQATRGQVRSLSTDGHGSFNATLLPVGTYTVVVRDIAYRET
jgi:uncharacterized surface anchored protein